MKIIEEAPKCRVRVQELKLVGIQSLNKRMVSIYIGVFALVSQRGYTKKEKKRRESY